MNMAHAYIFPLVIQDLLQIIDAINDGPLAIDKFFKSPQNMLGWA